MVVLGSNEEEGSNIAGITGGGRGVAGETESATSGVGSTEGTAGNYQNNAIFFISLNNEG